MEMGSYKTNMLAFLKAIIYYTTTYLLTYIAFQILYKYLVHGAVHPSQFNVVNTGILFLTGVTIVTVIRLIFYKKFSVSNPYFCIISISTIILSLKPEFLTSYYEQSTGYGGTLLEMIIYPFAYLLNFIYQIGLTENAFILVLIFFISYRLITLGLDKIIKIFKEEDGLI